MVGSPHKPTTDPIVMFYNPTTERHVTEQRSKTPRQCLQQRIDDHMPMLVGSTKVKPRAMIPEVELQANTCNKDTKHI